MLFTIQAFLDDYFRNYSLSDTDGYSVRFANLYYYQRGKSQSLESFLNKLRRVKTVFYSNNRLDNRSSFEKQLLDKLDRKFAKLPDLHLTQVINNNAVSVNRFKRVSLENLLFQFKLIVEATAVDSFWESRKKNKLKNKPEEIAQGLLASCLKMVLDGKAMVVRELSSGIGFVDLAVIFSSTLHLIEVKILTKGFLGIEQLDQYMKTENRNKGNLIVLDAMTSVNKVEIPREINGKYGKIKRYGNVGPDP